MTKEIKYDVTVNDNGDKEWRLNGVLHREDGPAVECADGHKEWHLNGQLHREDGPAVERADGGKYWYLDGDIHREDGPAMEHADGHKTWFLRGCIIAHSLDNSSYLTLHGIKYELKRIIESSDLDNCSNYVMLNDDKYELTII